MVSIGYMGYSGGVGGRTARPAPLRGSSRPGSGLGPPHSGGGGGAKNVAKVHTRAKLLKRANR